MLTTPFLQPQTFIKTPIKTFKPSVQPLPQAVPTYHVQQRSGGLPFVSVPNAMVNGFIGAMEASPILEMTVLDYGSMVLPRSYIEYRQRGPDMGRETLLMELAGNLSLVYLAGWFGAGATVAYNHIPLLNPKGLDSKAFINIDNARAFVGLTKQVLQENEAKLDTLTLQQVKEKIAVRFVESLHDEFQHGLPKALEGLPAELQTSPLTQTQQAKQRLVQLLSHGQHQPQQGAYAIEALVRESAPASFQEVTQLRHMFSKLAKLAENPVKKELYRTGFRLGLTNTVQLKAVHPEKTAEALQLAGLNLGDTLLQMKRYFEQGFDRVVTDAVASSETRVAPAKALLPKINPGSTLTHLLGAAKPNQVLEALEQHLVGEPTAWFKLSQYLPSAKDGFLRALEKQKLGVTGVSLLGATVVGVWFTFLDAYITKRLHHGKVFYPGDLPQPKPSSTNTPTLSAAASAAVLNGQQGVGA